MFSFFNTPSIGVASDMYLPSRLYAVMYLPISAFQTRSHLPLHDGESSSPPSSSRCKPIVNKQPHSSYFSIATHIKYRFRKLMTRTIQWWPRDDTDKDTHKDKYEDKDKDIQEESLPIYISLRILSSNEYI